MSGQGATFGWATDLEWLAVGIDLRVCAHNLCDISGDHLLGVDVVGGLHGCQLARRQPHFVHRVPCWQRSLGGVVIRRYHAVLASLGCLLHNCTIASVHSSKRRSQRTGLPSEHRTPGLSIRSKTVIISSKIIKIWYRFWLMWMALNTICATCSACMRPLPWELYRACTLEMSRR